MRPTTAATSVRPRPSPERAPTRAPRRGAGRMGACTRAAGAAGRLRSRSSRTTAAWRARSPGCASPCSARTSRTPTWCAAPRRPPGAPARARPRDRRGPYAPATGVGASSHGRCRPGVCPRRPRLPAEAHLSRRPAGTKQPQPHPRRACVGGPAGTRAQSRPSADAALPCARADLSVSEVSRNGGRHKARTAIPRHLRYPLPQPYPPRRAGADIQGAHDPRGHALGGQHEPGGQR